MSEKTSPKLIQVPSPNFLTEKDIGKPPILECINLGDVYKRQGKPGKGDFWSAAFWRPRAQKRRQKPWLLLKKKSICYNQGRAAGAGKAGHPRKGSSCHARSWPGQGYFARKGRKS